jgi:signal peptidase I
VSRASENLERDDQRTPPTASQRRRKAKNERQLPVWQEMLLLLGIALVLAIVIKAFFMQAFYIPSGSMNDTLVFNDRILVQKVSYWSGGPERGDVVVFEDPASWLDPTAARSADNPLTQGLELFGLYPTGGHLVKRVIAVGGDTVECCDKQGRMMVNGVSLNEQEYLARGEAPSLITFKEQEVPAGHIWVQGDNRSNSADSRVHLGQPGGGMVPVDLVVGKVFAVVWPLGNAKTLERPATFDSVGS